MRRRPAVVAIVMFLIGVALIATSSSASPTRGAPYDGWADIVIGQPSFEETSSNATLPNRFDTMGGVSIGCGKVYVADTRHHRVEGYAWPLVGADPLPQVVYGEPDGTTSKGNGDSGFQNYPEDAPANASTQRGIWEGQTSLSEGGSASSPAVDSQCNVYYFDTYNDRVVRYNGPDGAATGLWGQADFSGKNCNRGGSANASTLCYSWGANNYALVGVDVDGTGVWVTDNGNNRVLHFPFGGSSADIILGQPTSTSTVAGTNLNQMESPSVVRLGPDGKLYVVDEGNRRILRFSGPLTSGMSGELFATLSGQNGVTGLRFDPTRPGTVMILHGTANVIEYWDTETKTHIPGYDLGRPGDGNLISYGGRATRDFAVDNAGNVITIPGYGEHAMQGVYFARGADPTQPTFYWGATTPTAADLGFAVNGVAVADNQMIVAEAGRLLYWNNPPALTNHQSADGYASFATPANVNSFASIDRTCCTALAADSAHHVWTATQADGDFSSGLLAYDLPLTPGQGPVAIIRGGAQYAPAPTVLPVLGGGTITLNTIWGIVPNADSSALLVVDTYNSRVVRIRDPLTNPVVDAIFGQTSPSGTACNRGGAATLTTLCLPGSVSFDRLGNIWISDHSLEVQGNFRLLMFPPIPTGNATVIYAPAAAKVYPNLATWQPAFDSLNRMAVAFNNYFDGGQVQNTHVVGFITFPLGPATKVDGYFEDYGSPLSMVFDDQDNLYVADINRGRVLIYLHPLSRGLPTATPTPPPLATATATPRPAPTATCTPRGNSGKCR